MDPNFIIGYRYHPQAERWLPATSWLEYHKAVIRCYEMHTEQPSFADIAIFQYKSWHNGKPTSAPIFILPGAHWTQETK